MSANIPRWPFSQIEASAPAEYSALRRRGSATRVELYDGSQAWLLTTYPDVRSALRSPALSADVTRTGFPMPSPAARAAKSLQRSFVRLDPPEHDVLRGLVQGHFQRRQVLAMTASVDRIVAGALDSLAQGPGHIDLVPHFARRVPVEVACMVLGIPSNDAGWLQELILQWSTYSNTTEAVRDAGERLLEYLDHELDGGHSAGTVLATLAEAPHIDRSSRLHTAFLILVSGFHTTANMAALSLATLLGDRSLLERFRLAAHASNAAIDELVRFLSITRLSVLRLAVTDFETGGGTVRTGDAVIAAIQSANHDPAVFEQPDRLDFCRRGPRHLGFGDGIHNCLGQDLARIELRSALLGFVNRFPAATLAVDPSELCYADAATVGLASLPVRL